MAAAERVSREVVSNSVAEAVRLAGERHKLAENLVFQPAFGAEAARIPWWIAGRYLREGVDLPAAEAFALDVTNQVAAELGAKGLSPTVVKIGNDILAGYIDRFDRFDLPGTF